MSITLDQPSASGAEPQNRPAIDLTKHNDQAAEPQTTGLDRLKDQARQAFAEDGPVRTHLGRAWTNTGSWLATADVTDAQLATEVLRQRQVAHRQQETELRRQLAQVASQIIAAKRVEVADPRTNDPRQDGDAVAILKSRKELIEAQLRAHREITEELAVAPTAGEVGRARWGRRASRAAALVAGVVGGGIYLPMQSPSWLMVSLPAAAVALWRAGHPDTATPAPTTGGEPGALGADAHWPAPDQAIADPSAAPTVPGTLPADPQMPPTGTFPIARVTSPQWAGECIRRALVKQGIPVAELFDVDRQPWGWTSKVRISEGTPAAIIKAAPDLETLLDLETGRFIPTPTRRRAVIDLKVAVEDPFAFVPGPPRRAPLSMSIKDKAVLGYAMDGRPLEMSLYGQQGAIVAGSGGGKSANIRTFAEYLTACRDTVVVALDPSGVGLGPLGGAAALTLSSKEEIEVFLRGMHKVSLGRPALLGRLGMGTEWKPSPERPALIAIGDEWPQVTDGAKESGVGIQLTGRKVCVQLLIASQFATTDYIGSAIISNLALQVLGPCRQADVTQTFGGGAIDEGWLPHRLVPKQADELNDVGKFYLRGGGYGEPVIWKGNWYDDETCEELAAERAQAGIPQLDEESLAMGGKDFAALFTKHGTATRIRRATSGDRVLADTVRVLRAEGLDRARTETIARLLAELGTDYAGITAEDAGRRLRAAGAGGAVKIGAVDGRTNANGYKLADLDEALRTTI
ncbi:hypothetical protein [Kitasatospora terrestris]|uniref:FtsK domain-containing protein n=1 Tax=Kitasatospora terrestris TaxID=258051 RepID=A0ABP9E6Y7_9ACTN